MFFKKAILEYYVKFKRKLLLWNPPLVKLELTYLRTANLAFYIKNKVHQNNILR